MTQPELTEKQLAELTEILELAKAAEQKAREMSEFAEALEEKWKRRLENRRRAATQQAGEVS
jgi:polynucleotide 5'-kinase involved in rRNA processing